MGDRESSKQAPKLEVLQMVRCLGCGAVYSKPARGGTVTVNPGCPDCGYLLTRAEQLPDKCPDCGAPKEHFVLVTED